jgi:hypothetical protein
VRWDRFFEDLEDQLDSEWEAERAALDTEAERLRLSRVELRARLLALAADADAVAVHLVDGSALPGRLVRVGADWCAIAEDSRRAGAVIVPLSAVVAVSTAHDALLRSARENVPDTALQRRMGFGFVLRDLVRRRASVTLALAGGASLSGTIDRASADHLDLALHEPGTARRTDAVTGHRMVAFAAIAVVRVASPLAVP